MPIYYVQLQNNTDCRDDDVIRVRAKSRNAAYKVARYHCPSNYSIGTVYSASKFRKEDPEYWWMVSREEAKR